MAILAAPKPSKRGYMLVEFKYGDRFAPLFSRYTDRTETVPILGALGGPWESRPELEITLPENVGTLSPRKAQVELKLKADDFLLNASSTEPHSRVTLTIIEVQESFDGDVDVTWPFEGRCREGWRKPGGRSGMVRFEARGPLQQLQRKLGIIIGPDCPWYVFGRGCDLRKSDFEETGTITAIDGNEVTITGLADHSADTTNRYWHLGYVEVEGLPLMVFDWVQSDPTKFFLTRNPPARWAGASCKVVPGCDHSPNVCTIRYDNGNRWSGIGWNMPPYHPVIETGGN